MAGTVVFVVINLVTKGVLTLLETVLAPAFTNVFTDVDGDLTADTSEYIMYLGLAGLPASLFMIFKPTAPKGSATTSTPSPSSSDGRVARAWAWMARNADALDLTLLVASQVISAVGAALASPPLGTEPLGVLSIGFALVWSVGAPVADVVAVSLFSVLVSNTQGSQARAMSWITAAGSCGRILFPLQSGVLDYTATMVVCSLTSLATAAILVSFSSWAKRNAPPPPPPSSSLVITDTTYTAPAATIADAQPPRVSSVFATADGASSTATPVMMPSAASADSSRSVEMASLLRPRP